MEERGGLGESAAAAHNVIGSTVVVFSDNDDMSELTQSQTAVRGTKGNAAAATTHGVGGGHAAKTARSRPMSDDKKLSENAVSCRASSKRRRPVGKPPVHRPRSRPREDDCNAPPRERRRRRKTSAKFEEEVGPAQEETPTFRVLSRELKREGWTTKLSNKSHPGKRYYFNKQRGVKQWEYPGDWMIGLELNVPREGREDETYMNTSYLDEDRDQQRQRQREERRRRRR